MTISILNRMRREPLQRNRICAVFVFLPNAASAIVLIGDNRGHRNLRLSSSVYLFSPACQLTITVNRYVDRGGKCEFGHGFKDCLHSDGFGERAPLF